MDTLRYQNNLLISRNFLLSTCCCNVTSGTYWESVPCPLNTDLRDGICAEWEQCQFGNRVFVTQEARCENDISICEAQRIRINNSNLIDVPDTYEDIIYFQYTGIGGTTGRLEWGTENVTLIASGQDTIVVSLSNKTIAAVVSELMDMVNTFQIGRWIIYVALPDFNTVSSLAIQPANYDFLNGTIQYMDSKVSGLYLDFNGTEIYVVPSANLTTFESNFTTALQSAIGAGISVERNEYLETSYGENTLVFDVVFGGALCGINQPRITTAANIMPGTTDSWAYHDSNATYSYLSPESETKGYFVLGTGVPCGYETTNGYGPAYYGGVQCVPQKGMVMGGNQAINPDITGYCYDSCRGNGPLDNLENTFAFNSACYSMTKSFFLFGMDGRPDRDYWHNRDLHITPECDYPGDCASSVPCNCTPELFLPMWHKNVPWGPFGSYYKDVELDVHPAWEEPYSTTANPYGNGYRSFLSSGYETPRSGWDYRPYGFIQTIGEWTDTKEIGIYFYAFRSIPFAVGDRDFDDLDQYIVLDDSTIDPSLTVTYSNGVGCGPIQIGFMCSGKTIGDYLDAINAIKTSGTSTTSGCYIFGFCAGSDEARSMPANRIVNTSAEIFESNTAGFNGSSLGGVYADADLRSGSHLVMPKAYDKYFANSLTTLEYDLGAVTQYYQPLTPGPNASAATPPLCRAITYKLPKDNTLTAVAARGGTMWWTAMPLCRTTVLNVGLNTIEPDVDPVFTESWVRVATGIVTLFASGRHVATTGINTRPSGEYTVQNLVDAINGIAFTWASGTYSPFVATTDLVNTCWLNDVTSISGSSYTYDNVLPSTYNFSYREPLLNLAQTNISTAVHAGLQSDIRRLCYWGDNADNDAATPPCVPPNATKLNGIHIDCDGDNYTNGNWIVSYGCASPNCMDQWFIPATRCGCDEVIRCNNGTITNYRHPFNQDSEGDNTNYWNFMGYEGLSVYQPLLYVCEYNFHPECDIPTMVKVPFVVVQDGVILGFQNGTEDTLPGKSEFCSDEDGAIYSNNQGWCQYFDPAGTKVRLSEIPRGQFPLAYIAGRTAGAFCSTSPWNFDPRTTRKDTVPSSLTVPLGGTPSYFNFPDGCVDVGDPGYADAVNCSAPTYACFSCAGWDRICNLGIVYANYIDYFADPSALCALFRPILKNITAEDVCAGNTYGCNRIDIDCSTACCECGFSCANGSGACLNFKNNGYYTQEISYSYTDATQGYDPGPVGCDFNVSSAPGCLAYAPGFCISTVPGACNKPTCVNEGYITSAFTTSFTYNQTPCSCELPTTCTDRTYSYVSDCGYSITCGNPGCVTMSPADNPSPTTVCYDCNTPVGCPTYANETVVTTGIFNFDPGCIGGLGGWGIYYNFSFTVTTTYSSTGPDACDGEFECSFSRNTDADYEVYGGDSECANPAIVNLTSTESGSYSVGPRSWGGCDGGTTPDGQDLEYIWNWEKVNTFACGYAGLFMSGSGQLDGRFYGPYCLGA